jgi:hypothetical protein
MYCIFVDECGYQKNWDRSKAIVQQPIHCVGAVAISSGSLANLYSSIRSQLGNLKLPQTDSRNVGRGEEIKAASVDRGEGFWAKYPDLRNAVRRIYLDLFDVTYFVVYINKVSHKQNYGPRAKDPSTWGLQLLLERVQGFLSDCRECGVVFIDASKREEAEQRGFLGNLLRIGSRGIAGSRYLVGTIYEWHLNMESILEIHLGNSEYSLGLQIADFVARHTYSWRKRGKQAQYPGWSFIEPRLWKYPNHEGWGYKEFP